jgi:hypothetical protein
VLTYAKHAAGKDQVMRLTYQVDGDWLLNQSAVVTEDGGDQLHRWTTPG